MIPGNIIVGAVWAAPTRCSHEKISTKEAVKNHSYEKDGKLFCVLSTAARHDIFALSRKTSGTTENQVASIVC